MDETSSPDTSHPRDGGSGARAWEDEVLAAPDLSQFDDEDPDSAGEPGAGRLGGIDDQLRAEQMITEPDLEPLDVDVEDGSTEQPEDYNTD
ncbi:hypothetical protein ACQCSX_06685 [Pseudarthrobacter sp. P1]|uniref:hypothetical protein n=1 Tax=Pseudarthrobacter sp. P1 TaxID=3418418 RepID=UPI003CE7480F